MSGDGGEDGNQREWQNVRDGDQKSCRRIETFLNQEHFEFRSLDFYHLIVYLKIKVKNRHVNIKEIGKNLNISICTEI